MIGYRVKMGDNGRLVIPASFRKELHLHPGEELILRIEGNVLHLLSLNQAIAQAQTTVQKYAKSNSLVARLREMRDEDVSNE